jgi:hypothetical protein
VSPGCSLGLGRDPVRADARRVGYAAGMARSRPIRLAACGAVIALGLASRTPGAPPFVAAHAGDALYAVLVWLLLGVVFPRASSARLAAGAWGVCAAIEASQAFHPPWLDALRAHRLVALVLGRGFVWADLVRYAVGVGVCWAGEVAVRRRAVAPG